MEYLSGSQFDCPFCGHRNYFVNLNNGSHVSLFKCGGCGSVFGLQELEDGDLRIVPPGKCHGCQFSNFTNHGKQFDCLVSGC